METGQSEAYLNRLIVLWEWANAQSELANVLGKESVLAVNQLAATVEGHLVTYSNELLGHSLNPGRS